MLVRLWWNRVNRIYLPITLFAGLALFSIQYGVPLDPFHTSVTVGFQSGFIGHAIRILLGEVRPIAQSSPELRHLGRAGIDTLSGVSSLALHLVVVNNFRNNVVRRQQSQQPR